MRSPPPLAAALVGVLASIAALFAPACKGGAVSCTSDVTAGEGTYHGFATAPAGGASPETNAVQDACRQMCAATKAVLIEGCAARCVTDVAAGKLGAKTSCK